MSALERVSRAVRRPLQHRLVTLGVVLVTATGLGLAPLRSSADPGGDRATLDRQIAQLRTELEDTSQDLVEAFIELRRTQAQLPGAQQALAAATATLDAAERHNRDVALQLELARANEGKAADEVAANTRDIEQAQDLIGNMAADQYQSGGISVLSIALDAKAPGELADRMIMVDTIMRLQGDALRRLATMQAEAKAQQSHLIAVRKQVAALKIQAEAAVDAATQARDAAATAKAALDRLNAQQTSYAGSVAAKKAKESANLAGMQAASTSLQALIVARAAAARAGRRAAPAAPGGSGAIAYPVNAPVSSEFGMRYHPILGYSRLHAGIDFAAGCGTPVYAAAAGVIIRAGVRGGYGNSIAIDHGTLRRVNLTTTYNHLSRFARRGGSVSRGQLIAYSGSTGLSTGCHLHFETWRNGTPVNPRGWF